MRKIDAKDSGLEAAAGGQGGLGCPNAQAALAERNKREVPGIEPGTIGQNWDNSKSSQTTLSHPQDS